MVLHQLPHSSQFDAFNDAKLDVLLELGTVEVPHAVVMEFCWHCG